MNLDEFRAQIALWGHTCDGHDDVALMTEQTGWGREYGWWDRRWIDLLDTHRYHGPDEVDVPQWWALACAPDIAILGLETA